MIIKFLLVVFFTISCNSLEYKNPETGTSTPEWGPVEIKQTVQAMVESLGMFFRDENKKRFIELGEIKNKTSEHINTDLLATELTTSLLKEKITFIDSSKRNRAIKEAKLAQEGLVNERSAIPAGEFLSPNYILEGNLNDNVRYDRSVKTQYIVITLKLTEIASGAIRWQEQKKFLKVSEKRSIGW